MRTLGNITVSDGNSTVDFDYGEALLAAQQVGVHPRSTLKTSDFKRIEEVRQDPKPDPSAPLPSQE